MEHATLSTGEIIIGTGLLIWLATVALRIRYYRDYRNRRKRKHRPMATPIEKKVPRGERKP